MPTYIRKFRYPLALTALITVLWGLIACGNVQPTGTGAAAPTKALTATPTRIASPPLVEITALPSGPLPRTSVAAATLAVTSTPHICPKAPTNSVGGDGGITCDQASAGGQTQASPYYLTVRLTDGVPEIRWWEPATPGLHYDLYRADWPAGEWRRLTSVTRPTSAEVNSAVFYSWRDTSAQDGDTYRYGVRIVNTWGGISVLLVSEPITVP